MTLLMWRPGHSTALLAGRCEDLVGGGYIAGIKPIE
jgi:hypothetical protein